MRGLFITFEGPEGSGKSTQAKHLAARLKACGREVVATREPGGTATGELIREILQNDPGGEAISAEAEMLLFAASRAQLVRTVILPALARGAWVVCDRFADSTTVYQGHGRGLDAGKIAAINALAVGSAAPDRTFLLDIDVATGFERLRMRHAGGKPGLDRIEREAAEFHGRVRDGYLALARQFPERITVLNTSDPEDIVQERIWESVRELMQ